MCSSCAQRARSISQARRLKAMQAVVSAQESEIAGLKLLPDEHAPHAVTVYGRGSPLCDTLVQQPSPSRPIARGLAVLGLLAQVLVGQHADRLPLYRQRRTCAPRYRAAALHTDGLGRACSPSARSAGRADRGPHPASRGAPPDDGPVPMFVPGGGKTATGRLWTCPRDSRSAADQAPPAVFFRYTPAPRQGNIPRPFWPTYRACCRPTATAAFITSTATAPSAKRLAAVGRWFFGLGEATVSRLARDGKEELLAPAEPAGWPPSPCQKWLPISVVER
jgi:hypothetical protein